MAHGAVRGRLEARRLVIVRSVVKVLELHKQETLHRKSTFSAAQKHRLMEGDLYTFVAQLTSAGTSSSVVQICTSILRSLHTCRQLLCWHLEAIINEGSLNSIQAAYLVLD